MTETVYVLGAGFNYSVLRLNPNKLPPLARNFFQVFLASGYAQYADPYYGAVFESIKRNWNLDREALADTPFDIEEYLTFLESQLEGDLPSEPKLAVQAVRREFLNLLMMYLGRFEFPDMTSVAGDFGAQVRCDRADVLTFNYDTVAERSIESASGLTGQIADSQVREEDFDVSQFLWNRNLGYGIKFSEVALPIPGVPQDVSGEQYYRHPSNGLYTDTRVLKLHGSLNWLKYATQWNNGAAQSAESTEMVLDRSSSVWPGAGPARSGGPWEPVIVPPELRKPYQQTPFSTIWQMAHNTLAECERLIVVGYSFPPTDQRVRRLFLDAFNGRSPREVIMVNPDASIAHVVRGLIHHPGPVTVCESLQTLYGKQSG